MNSRTSASLPPKRTLSGRRIRAVSFLAAAFFAAVVARSSGGAVISADAVRASAVDAVKTFAAVNGLDVEVEIPHARPIEVRGTELPALKASLSGGGIRERTASVQLEITSPDGDVLRKIHLAARTRVFARAAVAARDIARGDSLGPGDVTMKRVEVGGIRGWYKDAEPLAGARMTCAVKEGAVLRGLAVRPAPLVKRGDKVILKAAVGSVEVTAQGEARTDGGKGESIRVFNEVTKTTIFCTVLDARTVLVGRGGHR